MSWQGALTQIERKLLHFLTIGSWTNKCGPASRNPTPCQFAIMCRYNACTGQWHCKTQFCIQKTHMQSSYGGGIQRYHSLIVIIIVPLSIIVWPLIWIIRLLDSALFYNYFTPVLYPKYSTHPGLFMFFFNRLSLSPPSAVVSDRHDAVQLHCFFPFAFATVSCGSV